MIPGGGDETTFTPIANRCECIPFRFSNFNRSEGGAKESDSTFEKRFLTLPPGYDYSPTWGENVDEEIRNLRDRGEEGGEKKEGGCYFGCKVWRRDLISRTRIGL